MQIDNGDCQVILTGYLRAIPNKKTILVERVQAVSSELYTIQIYSNDYNRLCKFGFIGMSLFISGDLKKINQKIKIIAKKIDFFHTPTSGNAESLSSFIDDELFSTDNIKKLKNALGYQSQLYFEAMKSVH